MKRIVSMLLCLCLLLSLAACGYDYTNYVPSGGGLAGNGDQTPTEPSKTEDTIINLTFYKEKGTNPYLCTDFTNRVIMSLLYQGLFAVDGAYQTEPVLCGSYTTSRDKRTHTFTVDPSATFSDGSSVTANDVVASLNAAKSSNYYSGRMLHISSISLANESEIVIRTDTEMKDLPILLDIPIVPSTQVGETFPIGSGPYVLENSVVGSYLNKRNNWWCNAQLPITASAIPLMEATSVNGIRDDFQFNGLDLALTDPSSDRYVDYRSDFELWKCESGIFLYIGCNEDSKVFNNATIRSALTYAIDRDALVSKFYRGSAISATLPASPASPYYSKSLAANYVYNAEKFAQAVKDTGKLNSSIVFLVNSDDSLRVRAARSIVEMLKAGGLQVTLKELGGTSYQNAVKRREFDLYLGMTRLSPNMDLSAFFHRNGALSYGGVDDVAAYSLCLDSLADSGNYYTLHRTVMEQGLLCPVLFCNYAVYTTRGVFADLAPARDHVFYYSIGKSMEMIAAQ